MPAVSLGAASRTIILASAIALACALAPTAALAADGSISGTISSGGKGLAGTVVVYSEGSFDTETTAASDGSYTVANLAEGSYQLYFDAYGNYLPQYYKDKTTLAEATPVAVSGGATASGIDAELVVGGQIEGKLTDTTGAPLADDYAYIYNSSGEFVDIGFTSEAGTYDVEGLPSGSYVVEFKRYAVGGEQIAYYKGQATKAAANLVSVTAGKVTAGIDEALPALGTLSGTVGDSEGHPLAGVGVQLLSGSTTEDEVKTSATGAYAFEEVLPGSYEVRFVPAEHTDYLPQYFQGAANAGAAKIVTVSSGATSGSIDAQLQTAGEIAGTVTNTLGEGLAGVQVALYRTPGTFPIAYATTEASGAYELPGLETGTYQLEFSASNYETVYYSAKTALASAETVAVSTGSLTPGIDARLPPAANVSGAGAEVATGEITGVVSGPGGAIEGAVVSVYDQHGHPLGRATTLANGTYAFNALPTGAYTVQFQPGPGQNLAPQFHAGTVDVSEGAITYDVDAQMSTGGSIAGVVQSDAGTPLAGIEVNVYRVGGLVPEEVASTVSAADGSYSVDALAGGNYVVRFANAFEPAASWVGQYYSGQPSAASADPVAVVEGATTAGVDARLVAGGTLSGTVRDSASDPVGGVRVEVLESNGGAYVSGTDSEADGGWSVGNLPAGSYLVRFVPSGMNLLDQYYPQAATQAAAQSVSLAAGAAVSGLDATLAPGSEISGTDGLDFSYVSILEPSGALVAKILTNGSGEYEALGLPEGSYVVRFEPLSYQNYLPEYYKEATTLASATVLSVSPTAPATGIDALDEGRVGFEGGAQITGTVTSESGQKLAGVQVRAYGAGETVAAGATTIANGDYTLVGLPAGSYRLEFQPEAGLDYATGYYKQTSSLADATAVALTERQSLSAVDETLAPGGEIEGTVTDRAGAGLGGVEVLALGSAGEALAQGTSAPDGAYAIAGLPSGGYRVEFEPSGPGELTQFYPGAASLAHAQAVPVSAGSATPGIDAQIQSVGSLAGVPGTGLADESGPGEGASAPSGTASSGGAVVAAATKGGSPGAAKGQHHGKAKSHHHGAAKGHHHGKAKSHHHGAAKSHHKGGSKGRRRRTRPRKSKGK
jgi:5-hydroxyisourate hydrolase-like protein (transthyretin family)